MRITATFDLNEPAVESVRRMAKLEPGWHMCDLIIRISGQDRRFQADFLRPLFQEFRRVDLKKRGEH